MAIDEKLGFSVCRVYFYLVFLDLTGVGGMLWVLFNGMDVEFGRQEKCGQG